MSTEIPARFRVGATAPLARRGRRRRPPRRRRRGRRPGHRLPARHRARGRATSPACGTAWRPRWRVIAPDWPGQGRSAPDREPPRAARYAALLEGLLDACGIARAVIVGNSIGGAAAIRFAAAHPERVTALVLENPGGLDRTDDLVARTAIRAMIAFFAAGARGASWFPAAFAAYYRMVLQRAAAAEERAAHRRLGAGDRAAAARRLDRFRRAGGRPPPPGARHPLPGAVRLGGARPAHPAPALPAGHRAASPARAWRPSRRPRPASRDAGRVRERARALPRAAPPRGAPGARVAGGMTADGARIRWCTPR